MKLGIEFFFRIGIDESLIFDITLLFAEYLLYELFLRILFNVPAAKFSLDVVLKVEEATEEHCKAKVSFESINQRFFSVRPTCQDALQFSILRGQHISKLGVWSSNLCADASREGL